MSTQTFFMGRSSWIRRWPGSFKSLKMLDLVGFSAQRRAERK
ncbi:MAG TPA: hypothetical protein VHY19_15950 [Steroidobacteraceae bacterium]|jgi:hypothetical protein|nr:hypothetical protein [Steroidobacteraceae bacterium]